jgi:hypothetical protein
MTPLAVTVVELVVAVAELAVMVAEELKSAENR